MLAVFWQVTNMKLTKTTGRIFAGDGAVFFADADDISVLLRCFQSKLPVWLWMDLSSARAGCLWTRVALARCLNATHDIHQESLIPVMPASSGNLIYPTNASGVTAGKTVSSKSGENPLPSFCFFSSPSVFIVATPLGNPKRNWHM